MITLATLPQATAQEVFDQVATHLLTQGRRAIGPSGVCKYRTEVRSEDLVLKCAAGCLISDEEYVELNMHNREGEGWGTVVEEEVAPKQHRDLIARLQRLHDDVSLEISEWPEQLGIAAAAFNLEFHAP